MLLGNGGKEDVFVNIFIVYIISNMVHVEGPSYGFRTDFVLQECPGD